MSIRVQCFAAIAGGLLLLPTGARASHLLGAEIDVYFLAGDQYEVRLLLWRDCAGIDPGTVQTISFNSPCGGGTLILLTPPTATDVSSLCAPDLINSTCNGGTLPGAELKEYSALVTLPPCDSWSFQWDECCLSPTLSNVEAGDMVAHTTLNNLDLSCRDTPRFAHPGMPLQPANAAFSLDLLGMIDGPGVPTYALVDLVDAGGTPLFYPLPYSGALPYPGMSIDAVSGVIATAGSAPGGGYALCVRLEHQDSLGNMLASVERVYLLINMPGTNSPVEATSGGLSFVSGSGVVTGPRSMDLQPGGTICVETTYTDPNLGDSVHLVSDIGTGLPGSSVSLTDGAPATASYCWTAPGGAYGVYRFITTATDDHCPVDGRQYYLYEVRIVPDTKDPCSPVGLVALPWTNGGMTAMYDPQDHSINWKLPDTRMASRLRLHDLQGAMLLDRPVQGMYQGEVTLSRDLADGVYVFECDGFRQKVLITR